MALLHRVEWDVELTGLREDEEHVNVDVKVSDVVIDTDARDAPVARIHIVSQDPVPITGLTLRLRLNVIGDGEPLCSWYSELHHDDVEGEPFDVAGELASREMDTQAGLHTARAWYSRSLPRTWFAVDVACSSLALARILPEIQYEI